MRVTRRGFARLGAGAALGLPWLAHPAPAAAADAGSASAVLGIDADPPTLNPAMSTDYATGDVGAKIFEGLVWLDRGYVPQPSLATGWTVTPDAKTYTFTLRQDVTWHDGQPFTADDVVFTFSEILAKYHPRTSAVLKTIGAVVTAPDPKTVVVTLQKGYAPFLVQMSVFDAPILPKHLYIGTDIPANPANQAPVGTGPFRFAGWNRGAAIRTTRNAGWWGRAAGLDEIIFQIVPTPANRSAGLETGEIDAVVDFYLPKPDEPRLMRDASLQFRKGINIPAVYFLAFNTTRPLFGKRQARQALACAIDRPRLVEQVMNGLARPGYGAFGDGFKWLLDPDGNYAKRYPLDPAHARDMLAQAGGAGQTVSLVYDAARPQLRATAQIIRDNCHQIGLDVSLQPLERAVEMERVFTQHDFDLTLQSYFSAGDPAIGYSRMYLTQTGNKALTNATGYSNPEVDRLLGEASVAPERERRADLYRQLQHILNEDLPNLILYDEETVDFATRRLTSLWPAIDARDQWGGVRLAAD
jgi:peptide/nickel transport system substrate-binding protein